MSFPCISAIFHRNCILLINDFVSSSADTVELLLPLAEKFSVTKLQAECETMLIGKFQSLKTDVDRMKYLLLAQSYTLPSLYDVCVNQLGHVPMGKLKKWRGFQEVSLTTMSDLMACRLQLMESCATEEEDANSVGILNEVVDYILGIRNVHSYPPTPTHQDTHKHTHAYDNNSQYHDDVIKWKHFPRHWPFVREIHRPPVNSPHKGQWRGALMFSLICV